MAPDYEKLFVALRLQYPDHDRLIESYLRFYEGTEKYEKYKAHYEEKKAAYEYGPVAPVAEAPEVVGEKPAEEVVEENPKKKGRPKKEEKAKEVPAKKVEASDSPVK